MKCVIAIAICMLFSAHGLWSTPVRVAEGGGALLPVVAEDASVREAAETLAEQLGRITGGKFEALDAADHDGGSAIFLRLEGDAPADLMRRERYIIASGPEGVVLAGATPLAVQNAVWDLLHRIGYRQYFPGPHWEIVPSLPDLEIEINVEEEPFFVTRFLGMGMGFWTYNREPFEDWLRKNRMLSGLQLRTSHSYARIINRFREEFDANPNAYAMVDGERRYRGQNTKLNLADSGVRETMVRYALDFFERNPDMDSISMDPSDGRGWCESPESQAAGSVSDQVVRSANQVAAAVRDAIGPRLVGIYAYADHSPPPTVEVDPQVVVSVATNYTRGGYTFEELVKGWREHGANIGVREYLSVHQWDRDLPGAARAARFDALTGRLANFHELGIRFFTAELSDSWGPHGPGYYLLSRFLWNPQCVERADAIFDEFLENSFGPAREPMRGFYQLVFPRGPAPSLSEDLIGRMFRALRDGLELAGGNADVRRRILDLGIYARYVELYRDYSLARGAERQQAFETLCRYAWRMRHSQMLHVIGLFRDLPNRDKAVALPEGFHWNDPELPWKQDAPEADALEVELLAAIADGIERHAVFDFETREFDDDVIPVPRDTAATATQRELRMRGTNSLYLYVSEAPAVIRLKVTGGLIAHYRDRGPSRLALYPMAEEMGESVATAEVPPDGEERAVELQTAYTGLHRLEIIDGNDMTRIRWEDSLPVAMRAREGEFPNLHGRWTAWFTVPADLEEVACFAAASAGRLVAPDDETLVTFSREKPAGYHLLQAPSANGENATFSLWKADRVQGRVEMLNTPAWLFFSPDAIWVPAELVP